MYRTRRDDKVAILHKSHCTLEFISYFTQGLLKWPSNARNSHLVIYHRVQPLVTSLRDVLDGHLTRCMVTQTNPPAVIQNRGRQVDTQVAFSHTWGRSDLRFARDPNSHVPIRTPDMLAHTRMPRLHPTLARSYGTPFHQAKE